MQQISQQTLTLAQRLQRVSARPLTQRQAIHRAVWLQEQCRWLDELAEQPRDRSPDKR
jgi:hypothetical protein